MPHKIKPTNQSNDQRVVAMTVESMVNAINAQKSFKDKSVLLDVSGKQDKKAS